MEERVYVFGIPAWITVADDGTVKVSVDLTELADAPTDDTTPLYDESGPILIPDEVRDLDSQRITVALFQHSIVLTIA